MKHGNLLTTLILLGLVAGVAVGQALFAAYGQAEPESLLWLKNVGDLVLIRPLTLMIIPLIFVSVIVGVTSLGDPAKLGVVGGSTVFYYMVTMLLAVVLGATLVSTFKPGVGLPEDQVAVLRAEGERTYAERTDLQAPIERAEDMGLGGAWMNILEQVVPTNIVAEMGATRPLGVIIFALFLGLALAATGQRAEPAIRFFDSLFQGLMVLVMWIIWLTPIGVFFLVAWTVGTIGLSALVGPLSKYMILVIVGLAIHGGIVLPAILYLLTRNNPYRFMWQMRKALMTAFGTDSSSATLPVTIQTAEMEGGCSKKAANFVLPLGATVNMDGTALYEAVAVVFLFQLFGIDLSFAELVIVVITATLAAVGAAGIPSAGLVTMVLVIVAVNRSLAGQGVEALPVAAIGIIIGVDRILDMCRTVVNVWGDAVGAKLITKLAPDTEEDLEKAAG
ncbi:MAG TPA: dicarboxylate/amino acid:cation symporter [Phycisphaerales bacterium]|nr:dicarboxylate/amino acid:cation symporter [Phycisphaerales bacterium]HRQ75160.1 dicarboxylate/amino acid:cation symporter [Phycisphaerales bacterium]